MKPILIVILALFINNGCPQKKQEMQAPSSVTYQTMTRGSSYECTVTSDNISVVSKGLSNDKGTAKIKSDDWTELTRLLTNIDLGNIENMESPSTDRYSDRSAIGSLQVQMGSEVYESSSFDDSNPPSELKPLIDQILALAETIE